MILELMYSTNLVVIYCMKLSEFNHTHTHLTLLVLFTLVRITCVANDTSQIMYTEAPGLG